MPDHGESTYQGSGKLTGLRTLITGGDSGIGRAVALAFAREGADVAITYLPEEQDDADATMELVRSAGRAGFAYAADLRSHEACADVVARAAGELGGLDVLVNNAGYQMAREGGIESIDPDRLDRVMKTNLYALFWMTQEALAHLKAAAASSTARRSRPTTRRCRCSTTPARRRPSTTPPSTWRPNWVRAASV